MRILQASVLAVLALALPVLSLSAQNPSGSASKWPESIAGKSLDQWIRELRTTRDPSVKENVLRTLPLFGPAANKAVPAVIELANAGGEDVSVRINACIALMTLDIPSEQKGAAVRALAKRMTFDIQAVVRLH